MMKRLIIIITVLLNISILITCTRSSNPYLQNNNYSTTSSTAKSFINQNQTLSKTLPNSFSTGKNHNLNIFYDIQSEPIKVSSQFTSNTNLLLGYIYVKNDLQTLNSFNYNSELVVCLRNGKELTTTNLLISTPVNPLMLRNMTQSNVLNNTNITPVPTLTYYIPPYRSIRFPLILNMTVQIQEFINHAILNQNVIDLLIFNKNDIPTSSIATLSKNIYKHCQRVSKNKVVGYSIIKFNQ